MRLLAPKFLPEYASEEAEWADNDLFLRGPFAKSLTNLVMQVEEPLVLGLYAKWGEGKSTFVEMWKRQLEKINGVPTIYIDAFENDYFEDPFVCLTGEVYAYAEEKIGTETEMIESIAKTGGKVGKIIAKSLGNIALRAATAGAVDTDDFGDISKAYSESLDELLNQEISTYAIQKGALKSFRDKLSEVAEKLGGGKRPLVIIVDELDRCKPTFSLEMLERIKHLFAVENVVFVLVLNPEQMGCVIKRVYGDNVDATDYLHKFIDMPVHLPINERTPNRSEFAFQLLHDMGLKDGWLDASDAAAEVCQGQGLSLREMQRVITLTKCSSLAANGSKKYYPFLAFLLSLLKVKHPHLYSDVCRHKDVLHKVSEVLKTVSDEADINFFMSSDIRLFGTDQTIGALRSQHNYQEDSLYQLLMSCKVSSSKTFLQFHIDWVNMFGFQDEMV